MGVWLGSFDELAGLEHGAGTDERDEVWRVHGAPAGLGGLDEIPPGPIARIRSFLGVQSSSPMRRIAFHPSRPNCSAGMPLARAWSTCASERGDVAVAVVLAQQVGVPEPRQRLGGQRPHCGVEGPALGPGAK